MCPDLPGQIVTAMVRQYVWEHRARGRRKTYRWASRVPVIAADLQAPNFGSKREPGAGLRRKQGLAQRDGATRTQWPGSRLRRAGEGHVGGYGAQSKYRKVRSVVDDRAESAGAQHVAAVGCRSRKPVSSGVLACHPAPARGAGAGDEVAHRALVGERAEPATAEPARPGFADVSQRGPRRPEASTTVSVVSMPGGAAVQAVGDGK